jgi:hypothetical protein
MNEASRAVARTRYEANVIVNQLRNDLARVTAERDEAIAQLGMAHMAEGERDTLAKRWDELKRWAEDMAVRTSHWLPSDDPMLRKICELEAQR